MKYFYNILFVVILSKSLLASDYNYNMEGIGNSTTKTMTLNNGSKFLLYENNIGWTDNLGNYGKSFCFGRIKIIDKYCFEISFNFVSRQIRMEIKCWSEFSRADTNMDAGAGKSKYIDGTGIYEDFIGSECIFSTKYLEDNLFLKLSAK